MSAPAGAPVPVTLLAGFLGAGKTTLVNRILAERHGEPIAVIVNEYGAAGVDGRLVVGASEEVVELANGCVCCTVREDLARALEALLGARERRLLRRPFQRVLVEASGLASPGPVGQTLAVDPRVAERVRLERVVTLAHAAHLPRQLAERPEAEEQIAYADMVLLNHRDRATPAQLADARAAVAARNALAQVLECERAAVDVARLFAPGGRGERPERFPGEARHAHGEAPAVSTVVLRSRAPLSLFALKQLLAFLANRRGPRLYRVKGLVRCTEREEAVLVQGMHDWLEIGPGPGPAPELSELVLIGRDLDAAEALRGWRAAGGDGGEEIEGA